MNTDLTILVRHQCDLSFGIYYIKYTVSIGIQPYSAEIPRCRVKYIQDCD